MRPTLHLTNWSSRGLHGPGRKLTIMALPRRWEHGDGSVSALLPNPDDLRAVKSGTLPIAEYRRRFEAHMEACSRAGSLGPRGLLFEVPPFDDVPVPVRDGDTLCCACSREAAARGECHRVWAAEALARAGWRVVLDGAEVSP